MRALTKIVVVRGLLLSMIFSIGLWAYQDVDILILNGQVLDGTGNPDFRADVAIRGDTIVRVGKLGTIPAKRVIDAKGLFVVPGFIDVHSHADRGLVSDNVAARQAHNLVAQGITTVVVAPDGRNALWPVAKEMETYRNPGVALNVVPMVGHATVRGRVMGDDYERHATAEEIRRMKELVRQGKVFRSTSTSTPMTHLEAGRWGSYRSGEWRRPGPIEAAAWTPHCGAWRGYSKTTSKTSVPTWMIP